MNTVQLVCGCGKVFSRAIGEHNRSLRAGQQEFCSVECSVARKHRPGHQQNLIAGRHGDEYTPFRFFAKRIRNGKWRDKSSISLSYLASLWQDQEGKCPYTGWNLILPIGVKGWENGSSPRNASLDRIDNAVGYHPGNVQFVALMYNMAKNKFTDAETVEFCKTVARRRNCDIG